MSSSASKETWLFDGPGPEPSGGISTRTFWILLLSFAFLLRVFHLFGAFYLDDNWHLVRIIEGKPFWETWHLTAEQIMRYWFNTTGFVEPPHEQGTYFYSRPLFVLTLWVEYWLFGFNPLGYHLHNILLHVVMVALTYLFARRFGERTARVAGIIMVIHPILVEPIEWICSRADIQAGILALLSFQGYLRYAERKRTGYLLFYLVMLFLGMLAKEAAGPVALAVAVDAWFRFDTLKNRLRFGGPALALLLVYTMLYRTFLVPPNIPSIISFNQFYLAKYGLLNALGNHLFGTLISFITGFYPRDRLLGEAGILGFIFLGGVLLNFFWLLRHHPLRPYFLYACAILAPAVIMPVAGRYYYPSFAGWAVVFAWSLIALLKARPRLARRLVWVFTPWYVLITVWSAWTLGCAGLDAQKLSENLRDAVKDRPELERVYLLEIPSYNIQADYLWPYIMGNPKLVTDILTVALGNPSPGTPKALEPYIGHFTQFWIYQDTRANYTFPDAYTIELNYEPCPTIHYGHLYAVRPDLSHLEEGMTVSSPPRHVTLEKLTDDHMLCGIRFTLDGGWTGHGRALFMWDGEKLIEAKPGDRLHPNW